MFCFGNGAGSWIEKSTQRPDGTLTSWIPVGGPYTFIGNPFSGSLAGSVTLTVRSTLFIIEAGGQTYKTQINLGLSNPNFQPSSSSLFPPVGSSLASWDRFVYAVGGNATNNVEFYDPDLAGTELYPDASILPISSSSIEIPDFMVEQTSRKE